MQWAKRRRDVEHAGICIRGQIQCGFPKSFGLRFQNGWFVMDIFFQAWTIWGSHQGIWLFSMTFKSTWQKLPSEGRTILKDPKHKLQSAIDSNGFLLFALLSNCSHATPHERLQSDQKGHDHRLRLPREPQATHLFIVWGMGKPHTRHGCC